MKQMVSVFEAIQTEIVLQIAEVTMASLLRVILAVPLVASHADHLLFTDE